MLGGESLASRSQLCHRVAWDSPPYLSESTSHLTRLVQLFIKMFIFFQGCQGKFGKYSQIKRKGELYRIPLVFKFLQG